MQIMPHTHFLSVHIISIIFIGHHLKWHIFHNFKSITFQPYALHGIIRQQAHFSHPKLAKNISTNPIITSALGRSFASELPMTPFSTTAARPVAIKNSEVAVLSTIARADDFLSLAIKNRISIIMPQTSRKYGNILFPPPSYF